MLIIYQSIPLLLKVPSEGKIEALVFRLQYLQKWYPGYICDNDLCFYQYVFEKLARWLQRLCTTPKHKAGLLKSKKGLICVLYLCFSYRLLQPIYSQGFTHLILDTLYNMLVSCKNKVLQKKCNKKWWIPEPAHVICSFWQRSSFGSNFIR